jgi:hypothetical protein
MNATSIPMNIKIAGSIKETIAERRGSLLPHKTATLVNIGARRR